jgi:hypothetical protein
LTAGSLVLLVASAFFYATQPRDPVPITPQMVADELAKGGITCSNYDFMTASLWHCGDEPHPWSISTSPHWDPSQVKGFRFAQDSMLALGRHDFRVIGQHWNVGVHEYDDARAVQNVLGGRIWCSGCGE